MAINYTWDVSNVDVYPTESGHSNVIYNVHWRLSGEDDANNDADGNPLSSSVYGSIGLDTSDLSNFTEFDNVTVSQVQGWVEAVMGADQVQAYKDGIDAQIAEKINPSSVSKVIGS